MNITTIDQRDVNINQVEPKKANWDRYIPAGADPARLQKDFVKWLNKIGMPKYYTNDEMKAALLKDLIYLSKMDSKEYTLYKKYKEIQKKYPVKKQNDISFLFKTANTKQLEDTAVAETKGLIWRPESPEDYLKLEPKLIYTEKKPLYSQRWTHLREFTSTMTNNPNIGRDLRFVIVDARTSKYLGCLCLSSDFMDLTGRDKFIGWNKEIKTTNAMINHTAIGSSIVPTQPLGYNYLGGKLMALLTLSKEPEQRWEEVYDCKLAGLTTTSLYGSYSQYTNLKYWIHEEKVWNETKTKKIRNTFKTNGSIRYEPEEYTVKMTREWLKYNYPLRYFEWFAAAKDTGLPLKRDHKQRALTFLYNKIGIDNKYTEAKHERGVFFCPLFDNSLEFLRMEIGAQQLTEETRRFDNSEEALTEIWREKYACKRIKNIIEKNAFMTETLFYDDLPFMKWEEVKEKYLPEVGRGK